MTVRIGSYCASTQDGQSDLKYDGSFDHATAGAVPIEHHTHCPMPWVILCDFGVIMFFGQVSPKQQEGVTRIRESKRRRWMAWTPAASPARRATASVLDALQPFGTVKERRVIFADCRHSTYFELGAPQTCAQRLEPWRFFPAQMSRSFAVRPGASIRSTRELFYS